jgi:hypothetical protein
MSTFCSYQEGVGVVIGTKTLMSDESVSDQFGKGGCGWFVEAMNQAAEYAEEDYCYVAEEYYGGSVLYMVFTKDDKHWVIDAYDTPQEAVKMMDEINSTFKEWKKA